MAARRLRRDAQLVRDLRIGIALGDELGDLELACGQGAPRIVRRNMAAGMTKEFVGARKEARARQSEGDLTDLGRDRHSRREPTRPDMRRRQIQTCPPALPSPPGTVPASDSSLQRGACRAGRARRKGNQAGAVGERLAAEGGGGSEMSRASGEPAFRISGSRRRLVGAHTRDHEPRKKRTFAGRDTQCEGDLAQLDGDRGAPVEEGSFGQTPERRESPLHHLALVTEPSACLQESSCALCFSAPEGDEAKRPPGHRRSSPTAAIGHRLLTGWDRCRPASSGPIRL